MCGAPYYLYDLFSVVNCTADICHRLAEKVITLKHSVKLLSGGGFVYQNSVAGSHFEIDTSLGESELIISLCHRGDWYDHFGGWLTTHWFHYKRRITFLSLQRQWIKCVYTQISPLCDYWLHTWTKRVRCVFGQVPRMMTTSRERRQAVPNKDMKPFPILAKWIKICVESGMLTALATRRLPTHTRTIAEPNSKRNTHSNSAQYMSCIWLAYSLCSVEVLSMALLDTISLTIVGHTDAIDWRASDNLHRLATPAISTCFAVELPADTNTYSDASAGTNTLLQNRCFQFKSTATVIKRVSLHWFESRVNYDVSCDMGWLQIIIWNGQWTMHKQMPK